MGYPSWKSQYSSLRWGTGLEEEHHLEADEMQSCTSGWNSPALRSQWMISLGHIPAAVQLNISEQIPRAQHKQHFQELSTNKKIYKSRFIILCYLFTSGDIWMVVISSERYPHIWTAQSWVFHSLPGRIYQWQQGGILIYEPIPITGTNAFQHITSISSVNTALREQENREKIMCTKDISQHHSEYQECVFWFTWRDLQECRPGTQGCGLVLGLAVLR